MLLTFDYQCMANPARDRNRRPVSVVMRSFEPVARTKAMNCDNLIGLYFEAVVMTEQKPLIRAIIAIGFLFVLDCAQSSALARGSAVIHDDPWDPARIDRLPPDVRRAVLHMCPERPTAAHYFATYLDNSKIVRLHFEYFNCEGKLGFCRDATSCLREEFVSSDSRYRLLRSYYGPTQ
jgi:hypothetical protein